MTTTTSTVRSASPTGTLRRLALALGLTAAAGLGLSACSAEGGKPMSSEGDADVGAVGLALQLAPGLVLNSASYTVTGQGGFSRTGTIDVSHSSTLSAVVAGIPAGAGYTISITATTADGSTTCAGSAIFNIVARTTTAVTVHLTCHEAPRTGTAVINGTVNVCPVLDGITASPAEVIVGNAVSLAAIARDADRAPSPLAYHWTTSGGTLDNASSATPSFTCLFPGPVTLTVAVSDGDPAPGCTDSGSVTVTCTSAGPQVYAWVELGSGGQAIARLVTPDAACPPIAVDGVSRPMNIRAPAGTLPLRTTASAPADSKPSAFPVTACELTIPAGATQVVAAGRALPLPKASPNRIVVIGDTGCRLKIGNPWQACSDPNEWPYKKLADLAATLNPDLVLHVGDHHYRENACPPEIAGCQGSPWGYGWDTWEADVFKPAAGLLAAAPWIIVRGNHEECARGGQGWFRFFDTEPYQATRTCDDPANDDFANYSTPYAVPVGADSQVIVFDSAKIGGALAPTSAIFLRYQSQFQTVAALAARPGVFSMFANHHPVLGFTPVAGNRPTGGLAGLISVLGATFPGTYFPPGVKLVLEGHVHLFQAINFATPNPVTILAGNGGDNLDLNLPDPFPLGPASAGGVEPAPGAVVDSIAHTSTFGFVVLDRAGSSWNATAYKHDGTVMTTCGINGLTDKIACSASGFVH